MHITRLGFGGPFTLPAEGMFVQRTHIFNNSAQYFPLQPDICVKYLLSFNHNKNNYALSIPCLVLFSGVPPDQLAVVEQCLGSILV